MRSKVICFLGAGRSGTTLIARVLGAVPGYRALGELTGYVLDPRMRTRGIPCSCARQVDACTVWGPLLAELRRECGGDFDKASLMRLRFLPSLRRRLHRPSFRRRVHAQEAILASAYRFLEERYPGTVFVDSTKHPVASLLLASVDEIDLYVLHIVRHPYAFIQSRGKSKGYLRPMSTGKATTVWALSNLAGEWLAPTFPAYRKVRYEDFVSDPDEVVQSIVRWILGEKGPDVNIGMGVPLPEEHLLAGNPDKLERDTLTIRAEKPVVKDSVHPLARLTLAPFLRYYGYVADSPRANEPSDIL